MHDQATSSSAPEEPTTANPAVAAGLLRYLASILVDHPEDVVVSETDHADGGGQLRLTVRREDVGKVIGKQGRTARAIRNLVQTAGVLNGERVQVQVIDD